MMYFPFVITLFLPLCFFAENVRQSNSLDEEVYTLLERMEALQSLVSQDKNLGILINISVHWCINVFGIWGIAWWGINIYLVCSNTMCVSTCWVDTYSLENLSCYIFFYHGVNFTEFGRLLSSVAQTNKVNFRSGLLREVFLFFIFTAPCKTLHGAI